MNHRGWPLAAGGSLVALVGLIASVVTTNWTQPGTVARLTRLGPEEIGTALFTVWAVPFELASVVLLVALVGSLLIARATDLEAAEEGAAMQGRGV